MVHPAVDQVLQYFAYDHLPAHLQEVSKPFHDLAHKTASNSPDSPETTVALRKLLEAKDAAVRAKLPRKTVAEAAKQGWDPKQKPEG